MIRAAIFDLDGTLVDSLPGIANALNRALASLGRPTHPLERVRSFIGNGSWVLARLGLGDDPPDHQVDAVQAAFLREYAATWQEGTSIYPGLPELIADLHRAAFPLAVFSNKPHRFTVEIVEALFPDSPFAAIVGQRDNQPRKPDPAGALDIAAGLAVPPAEIAFVGDSTIDYETARAAGMHPFLVTWGFHPLPQLTATGAPLLHSPEDLRKALRAPRRGA